MVPYISPDFEKSAFNCPYCYAYAQQSRVDAYTLQSRRIKNLTVRYCSYCGCYSIWLEQSLLHPSIGEAPPPNIDLPAHIITDYEEAKDIVSRSPRGACALLRLSVQKLCVHLGEKGRDLNDDIASLVKKGLSEKVQKALDTVRVIGNNAVHPGELNLKDDRQTAVMLFEIINIIVQVTITENKDIDSLYQKIPASQKDAIAKRDEKNSKSSVKSAV
jgi:hypothetical protein